MYRCLSHLFLLAAVAAAAWGGFLALAPPDAPGVPEPAVLVVEPNRRLGGLAVGDSELTFIVRNDGERPAEIVGLAEG